MFKLLAFAAVLAAVNGANLLGAKECTYGPSYWCASLENAAKCSATQHCLERVWKTQAKPTVKDSDACTFCKDMVNDVKNFIDSNTTKATIMQYLNRACDFMPDTFSLNECKKVEQHYFNEFYQIVDGALDADTICNLIKLCGNSKVGDLKKAAVIQPAKSTFARVSLSKSASTPVRGADGLCDECKSMIGMVKTYIDDKDNQDKIKSMLETECQQLGGDLAAECKTLVDTFLPEMISLMDQELTDQLCVMIGLCNSTVSVSFDDVVTKAKALFVQKLQASRLTKHITGVASRVSADYCTTCEEVINYVKLFINNNGTESEVEQLLENDVCPQLGEFSSMCKELVSQYMPQIWSRFIEVLDPKTLCTDLGLCNATTTITAPKLTMASSVKPRVKASVQCVLCEFVISKLDSMLADNATEQEIEQAVEKVCNLLPSTISSECDSLVEQYGPAIIKLLASEAAPATICGFLGLCGSGDAQYKMPLTKVGDENCMMCELAMSYVKSMLSKNATEQQVEQTLEKVCNYLSGDMAQQCNTMVEQYTPQILKMLAGDLVPKAICTKLGLCTGSLKQIDGLVHLYNSNV